MVKSMVLIPFVNFRGCYLSYGVRCIILLLHFAEVFDIVCFSFCPLCLVPVHGLMLNDD